LHCIKKFRSFIHPYAIIERNDACITSHESSTNFYNFLLLVLRLIGDSGNLPVDCGGGEEGGVPEITVPLIGGEPDDIMNTDVSEEI
jgi:hypothetical protein